MQASTRAAFAAGDLDAPGAFDAEAALARERFLRANAKELYAELTDDLTVALRLDELVYRAAEHVPGLTPTRERVAAERERLQGDKDGVEIAQGLLLAHVLASPHAGSHLVWATLRPTAEALERLDDFRLTGVADLGGALVRREGIAGVVVSTRRPVVLEDAPADGRVVRVIVEREAVRSLMAIPIVVGGQVFGVFGVNYLEPHRFTAEEQRVLLALAQRTALAIDNARLYEQAQQAAVLEERQRLARELHDSVTQTLFSATLTAEVLPRLWRENPDEAEEQLEELRQLTRGALAEMRALLLELRPAALLEVPLGDLLKQLCAAFIGRARVPADLLVEGNRVLPPDVQTAFYRLAQEALNNVAKHADARRVAVALTCGRRRTELRVTDDGRGFDPERVELGHLGLGIMRERVAAIGATVDVISAAGQGTAVTVVWEDSRPEEE